MDEIASRCGRGIDWRLPPWLIVILVCSFASLGCRSGESIARSTRHFPKGTGFVRTHVTIDGADKPMWVFVPRNYSRDQSYPTILFLHGLFEAGNDGSKCLTAGLGPVIAKSPDTWQFITIFPQSTGTWRGEKREKLAIAALDQAERTWSIDRDRVILAGLSYGGLGTWEIGAKNWQRFAALVPVSGHSATSLIEKLILLPVWAFHYRGDPFVPASGAEQMCNKIAQRGGNAKLTAFSGIGHDAWERAVAESSVVAWMLHQQRRASAVPAAVAARSSGNTRPTRAALANIE
jgi:predicted peptidase